MIDCWSSSYGLTNDLLALVFLRSLICFSELWFLKWTKNTINRVLLGFPAYMGRTQCQEAINILDHFEPFFTRQVYVLIKCRSKMIISRKYNIQPTKRKWIQNRRRKHMVVCASHSSIIYIRIWSFIRSMPDKIRSKARFLGNGDW